MCTSTSASRHRPRLISLSASSGSAVGMASYPMLATTDVNISSCPGSSSRMQGVSDVLGTIDSAGLAKPTVTMPAPRALRVPFLRPCLLLIHTLEKDISANLGDCQSQENAMLSSALQKG